MATIKCPPCIASSAGLCLEMSSALFRYDISQNTVQREYRMQYIHRELINEIMLDVPKYTSLMSLSMAYRVSGQKRRNLYDETSCNSRHKGSVWRRGQRLWIDVLGYWWVRTECFPSRIIRTRWQLCWVPSAWMNIHRVGKIQSSLHNHNVVCMLVTTYLGIKGNFVSLIWRTSKTSLYIVNIL